MSSFDYARPYYYTNRWSAEPPKQARVEALAGLPPKPKALKTVEEEGVLNEFRAAIQQKVIPWELIRRLPQPLRTEITKIKNKELGKRVLAKIQDKEGIPKYIHILGIFLRLQLHAVEALGFAAHKQQYQQC